MLHACARKTILQPLDMAAGSHIANWLLAHLLLQCWAEAGLQELISLKHEIFLVHPQQDTGASLVVLGLGATLLSCQMILHIIHNKSSSTYQGAMSHMQGRQSAP